MLFLINLPLFTFVSTADCDMHALSVQLLLHTKGYFHLQRLEGISQISYLGRALWRRPGKVSPYVEGLQSATIHTCSFQRLDSPS